MAKARLLAAGALPPDYSARFCHPGGTDGQFLSFFLLDRESIVAASVRSDDQIAAWFAGLPSAPSSRIEEWNHLAVNLGRPGFPLAERLPLALATTYASIAHLRKFETVFELLEADESIVYP
jgi:hypothetical protein